MYVLVHISVMAEPENTIRYNEDLDIVKQNTNFTTKLVYDLAKTIGID